MAIELLTKSIVDSIRLVYSPTSVVAEAFAKSLKGRQESHDLGELRVEAERRELEMRMSEAEARVAQELAIARRIETAQEVEMTEYFDYSGDGHLGMRADRESISLGAGGSGRRVSKRTLIFKGGPALAEIGEAIEQSLSPTETPPKV
ncbi:MULTISPECIES: hypothetical protein [Pseudomonas]|uniref:hypothetical protein n=1 Tax=Pseudomonas TaxID=286 RepID=UPI00380CEC25